MTPETGLAALPERLRLRIVALVSDALPSISPLPATLRKVAGFSSTRRARLGRQVIVTALDDDEFRRRCAVQVAARPERPGDELDAAARAWLARPDGWEAVVEDVVRRLAQQQADPDPDDQVERLLARVASLEEDLRSLRAEQRASLEETKAENATLRRRLGEARRALRTVEAERESATAERDEATRRVELTAKTADTETRRLRRQLDEAAAELSSSRRESRSSRDAATLRTRLLLDTLIDAASGLRRELGLPAAEGSPGDTVEAGLLGQHGARTTSAPSDPAALERILSLPHSRLLIDGYNVTKSVWGSATLEAQRSRLVTSLASVVARTGAETTVVFDAASAVSRPVLPAPRGVKVVYSPPGVIADDVIRSLVAAEPPGRVVVVVTEDQEVVRDVRSTGARVMTVEALVGLLGR